MKHEHLNRITCLVKGESKEYTCEEQIQYLKPVKAAYDIHHGNSYTQIVEEKGKVIIKLNNGKWSKK